MTVPINADARGALMQARDSFDDFSQEMERALLSLAHCGVADLELQAKWFSEFIPQMRTNLERVFNSTTALRRNAMPKPHQSEPVKVPILRGGR